MISNLDTVKKKVKTILLSDEMVRDDDAKLISKLWYHELKAFGLEASKLNGYQLLNLIAHNKVTKPSTVIRVRRTLQQEYPELKGGDFKEDSNKQKEHI